MVIRATSGEQPRAAPAAARFDVVIPVWAWVRNEWLELAGEIQRRWPDLRSVLATGWRVAIDAAEALQGPSVQPGRGTSRGIDATRLKFRWSRSWSIEAMPTHAARLLAAWVAAWPPTAQSSSPATNPVTRPWRAPASTAARHDARLPSGATPAAIALEGSPGWLLLFEVMRHLGRWHGDGNVRTVVWFDI